jgi:hypothetical protein
MALEKWGSSFVVNHSGGFHAQSSIAGLKDGSFVAVWMDKTPGDDNPNETYANRGQLFNADGTPRGNAFWIDGGPSTTPGEAQPSVTALNDGRFEVGWTVYGGSSFEVAARSFDPFAPTDGAPTGGAIASPYTSTDRDQTAASVTGLAGGGYAIGYTDANYSAYLVNSSTGFPSV